MNDQAAEILKLKALLAKSNQKLAEHGIPIDSDTESDTESEATILSQSTAFETALTSSPMVRRNPLTAFYDFLAQQGSLSVDTNEKTSLVYGIPQVGKRGEIICAAGAYMKSGRHVFVITDNYTIQKALLDNEFGQTQLTRFNETRETPLRKGMFLINLKEHKSDEVINSLAGGNPKIIVCNAHHTPLGDVNRIITECAKYDQHFGVIFDESDVATVKDKNLESHPLRVNKVQEIITSPNVNALFVTATPGAHLSCYQDINIKTDNVHKIEPGQDFNGAGCDDFDIVSFDSIGIDDFDKDEPSRKDIRKIINNHCLSYKWKGGEVKGVLITLQEGSSNAKHERIRKNLRKKFPESFINVVNKSQNHISYPVSMERSDAKDKCSLNQALREYVQNVWLDHCKGEMHHLFVIAGKMVGRSVAPRAEPVMKPKSYFDFICCTNHIFIETGKTQDNIVQSGSRCQGWYPVSKKHPTRPRVKVFTTKLAKNVIENYNGFVLDNIEGFQNLINKDIVKNTKPVPIELQKVKICPASKVKKTSFKKGGKVYLSKEACDNQQTGGEETVIRTSELNEDTIGKRIYDILVSVKDWMTVREVYNSCESWGLTTGTPLNTISTHLIRLKNDNIIIRKKNDDNIYVYKV